MYPVVHRFAAAAAAVALFATQAPAQASTAKTRERTSASAQKNPLAGLDQYVERAMKEWHVPGLAIAIVKDDSVVYSKGFGVRELGKPDRVDSHTIFAIGSNSKAFTSAAVGIMVDRKKMRWDDKVTSYLPNFQLHDPYVTREITVRDALSHRSGLGRQGDMLWYGTSYDRDEILRRTRFLEPNSSFRSQFGYSNIMFLAAGQSTAKAAGERWDDVIISEIFRPLGMNESSTSTDSLRGKPDVATPHLIAGANAAPIPWRNLDNMAPAGSINSSVADMTHWIRMQLDTGVYAGKKIISAKSLYETHSPQTIIASPPDTLFPSNHFSSYGMGWVLQDYRGRELVWHNGGIDGMLSEVRLVPEEKLGLVILSNAEGHNMNPAIAYRIIDAYLGAPPRDWSAIFLAQQKQGEALQAEMERKMEAARAKDSKPSLALDRYVGTYADSMYGEATVKLESGKLVVRYGPAFTGDLEHWNYDTFRASWRDKRLGKSFITFALDARARVSEMKVEGLADFAAVRDTTSRTASR
ncbi:MAG TPA: serine hydrolase [Gemmatimonadaceae bacterium]|nr:serine hydrolase [Gemmatimonadaceae bacterium]